MIAKREEKEEVRKTWNYLTRVKSQTALKQHTVLAYTHKYTTLYTHNMTRINVVCVLKPVVS